MSKTSIPLILCATLLAGALTGCHDPRPEPGAPAETSPANTTNHFTITGMHCDGCAGGLTSELKRTPGVTSAQVAFSNQLAVVVFDPNRVTSAKLVQVIEEAGFKAEPVKP